MSDSDPKATFGYATEALNQFNLAYLHLFEATEADLRHGGKVLPTSYLRSLYKGTLMVNGGYDKNRADAVIATGQADLVAFGTLFISNPDLPRRFALNAPLNEADSTTFYGGGEKGYIDYPTLDALPVM